MSGHPSMDEVRAFAKRLAEEAEAGGYHLNPDDEFTLGLVEALMINEGRYGYPSCPCRLASGDREEDLDIVCPCDYRDPDLSEFGACYCALYVSDQIASGKTGARAIPERRPPKEKRGKGERGKGGKPSDLPYPVWRCRVCGYLCARDAPPESCPVCRAKRERFERFM